MVTCINSRTLTDAECILIRYSSMFMGLCDKDIRKILKKDNYDEDIIDDVINERIKFRNSLGEMLKLIENGFEKKSSTC